MGAAGGMTKRNAVLLFAALIIVWGLNWSVVKLTVLDMPPIWAAALRCVIAAAALIAAQRATRRFIIPQRQDLSIVFIVGMFHIASTCIFMALGLRFVGAGRSVVLGYTTPLWVVPGAWLFLKESLPPLRLAGLLLGICGLLVLGSPASMDWHNGKVLAGHAFLLFSALCWAVTIISIRRHKWLATPFQLVFWQALLAAVSVTAAAFLIEGPPDFTLTRRAGLLLLYSGIPATAGAFWGMTVINRVLPATLVSLSLLATPVAGIVVSLLLLGEAVDLPLAIATVLILGGIALGTLVKTKPENKNPLA
jgi:drug/metabolite transporter (DMT)-like permease